MIRHIGCIQSKAGYAHAPPGGPGHDALPLAGGWDVTNCKESSMKFHIVSDSSCDLGRERALALGVDLVSYYASRGDEVYYREERDLSTRAFYQRMADNPGVFPKTSMPTIQDYLDVFRPLAQQNIPILCICLNARFSGSYQCARNAGDALQEECPGAQLYVLDSQLATVLQGLLVEEAAQLRDQDYTLEETVAALEPIRSTGRIFFTTNDLEYLQHGGRIGKAAAATGSLLKVKPLIGYQDCGLVSLGIAQGRKKSLQRVRELFLRYVQREQLDLSQWRVVTGFGLDREEYDAFTDSVFAGLEALGHSVPRSQSYQIGVTIGVHTGPTPIGVGILRRVS